MENTIKLPNELCQKIFALQFQMDIGNVSQSVITKTIELYVEVISIYTNLLSQNQNNKSFNKDAYSRRNNYYQDKIKRLLVRKDVQQCLLGQKSNNKTINLQRQIQKIKQNAPEQAKTLISFYKNHMINQQKIIQQSISHQQKNLAQRIKRRSLSKSKNPQKQNLIDLPKIRGTFVCNNL